MAVEDHPMPQQWSAASDHRQVAERRYWRAWMENDPAIEAARLDLEKAQKVYDEICEALSGSPCQPDPKARGAPST